MKEVQWNHLKIKKSANKKHFEHDLEVFIHKKDLKLTSSDGLNEFVMKEKHFKNSLYLLFFNIIHIVHWLFRSWYHFCAFFWFRFIHVFHSFLFSPFIFFIVVSIQFWSRSFLWLKSLKSFIINLFTDNQGRSLEKISGIAPILLPSKKNWAKEISFQFKTPLYSLLIMIFF